jgi:hypothetical protein
MRTVEQVSVAALSRTLDFGANAPSTRSLLYRRISIRQQELFSFAAQVNPEYYGTFAIGTLDAGAIDLRLMLTDGVREAVAVTKIQVEAMTAPSTTYAVGDEITIVPASDDPGAYLAPRATIRDHVLRQVGTDLAEVEDIRMSYSYRPDPLAENEAGTTEVGLEAPFDELLVIDLTRHLLAKTLKMDAAVKAAAIVELTEEEKVGMAEFTAHLSRFLMGRQSRMAHSQGGLGG